MIASTAWSSCATHPENTCERRTGRRVLEMGAPDHDDVVEGLALRVEACPASILTAGSRTSSISSTAAMCIAVGNVSFED